jgi:hypothetical protein
MAYSGLTIVFVASAPLLVLLTAQCVPNVKLLVIANVVTSSPILVTPMMEAVSSA